LEGTSEELFSVVSPPVGGPDVFVPLGESQLREHLEATNDPEPRRLAFKAVDSTEQMIGYVELNTIDRRNLSASVSRVIVSPDERDRLEREQRNLSRKEHRSNNWEKQRQTVAERYQKIKRKRRDFLHKLSAYYAREYDLVAVEDLNVKGMLESPRNSRNRASAAWGTFLRMLEYKSEREGTHFVAVDPRGTTKECAGCGVETDKPLWVREHSCPSCGFEADRDLNAAWNVLSRGLSELGVVHSEGTSSESP